MSIFEATGINDPLGLWDSTPQTISFGIGNEFDPETAAPVYHVNLPANLDASSQVLAEQLARFERMNAALDQIPSQLDGLVRQKQKADTGVSFGAVGTSPPAGPEGDLLRLLADTDAAALSGNDLEDVSFGVNEIVSEALVQAKEKFTTLLEQVNQDILHFAWVETKIIDLIIARTKVGWSGDSTTILNGSTSAEHTFLHQKTLEVVSQTRNLKLHMLLTISAGAVKVAVLMAAPGGPMLALPAVSEYVMKILEQAKQIQSIQIKS